MRLFRFALALALISSATAKHRVLVLTDITNEPDDEQSMVRFLLYSNEFDVEGLLATTSTHLRDQVRPEKIRERIEAYRMVRPNLVKHAKGWPTADYLLSITKEGRPEYGMQGVGDGKSTPASRHIIAVVDKPDPRPVWITVWGGSTDLAQAIWDVRSTRSKPQVDRFIAKMRVYDIAGQDDTGAWICHNFPRIFWVRNQQQFQAISIRFKRPFPAEVTGPRTDLFSHEWVDKHVQSHGALGKLYPDAIYKYEGDTPAFFYLLPNGLHEPEHPHYGGWGGRFTRSKVRNVPMTGRTREDQNRFFDFYMYSDAADTWSHGRQTFTNSKHAPLFRWREAFNNDFAARMDWSLTNDYAAVNHNPVAAEMPSRMHVTSGETVTLSAEGSADPDGDQLAYRWFQYPEPGTYPGLVQIRNANRAESSFITPAAGTHQSVHVILEVTDSGEPPLTSYRRVIISIAPKQ